MLVAGPGQSTTSYPAVLHNSSNVVVVPSQKKCRIVNDNSSSCSSSSPINVNGDSIGPSVSSKILLNSFNSMPRTLKKSSTNIHNKESTPLQHQATSHKNLHNNNNSCNLQNDVIDINNSSRFETRETNNTSANSNSSSSSSDKTLMKTLSVRLNRDPDVENSIPRVIISSKKTKINNKLNNDNPSSSKEPIDGSVQSSHSNSNATKDTSNDNDNETDNEYEHENENDNKFDNESEYDDDKDNDNDTIIQSPISIASSPSSSSKQSSSKQSSPNLVQPIQLQQKQIQNQNQQKQIQTTITDNYTVPPTKLHRSEESRKDDTCSTNSLLNDMCHFKPIRYVPITPFKYDTKLRGAGSIYANAFNLKNPQAIKALKKGENLKENCDEKSYGNKDKLRKTVAGFKIKKSKLILPSNKHKSAFVNLLAFRHERDKAAEREKQQEEETKAKEKQKQEDKKKAAATKSSRKRSVAKDNEINDPPSSNRRQQSQTAAAPSTRSAKFKKPMAIPKTNRTVGKKNQNPFKKPIDINTSNGKQKNELLSRTSRGKAVQKDSDLNMEAARVSPPTTRSRLKSAPGKKLAPGMPYYAKGRDF